MMNWLRNTSVGFKVAFAPGLGVLFLVLVGAIGLYANQQLSSSLAVLSTERMPSMAQVNTLAQRLGAINTAVNQSLAWEGAGFKEERIATLDKRIATDLETLAKDLDTLQKSPKASPREKELIAVLAADFGKYRQSAIDALDIKTGMLSNAASFMTVTEVGYDKLTVSLEKLIVSDAESSALVVSQAKALSTSNATLIATGCMLSAALAVALAWLGSRLIVTPLKEAADLAHAMAKGDFTVQPSLCSTDATGQVLSAMSEVALQLSRIVDDIRAAADEVDTSSTEIALGNANLSHRTENTAAALEKTATSLEQLTVTLQASARNAAQANALARQASEVADEGGRAVSDVVETMQRIDAQAKKISEIIGVIDGIAFQTNILALNAAVEAARAGEQGRGFAVVAQEVRTLAQRSGDAAKEIRTLIVASVEQAEMGAHKVQAAGATMQRIVASIRSVSATVDEISRATSEQASGISEVNSAVAEMDRHTQQNAAMVQEAAAAAASLKLQAHRLSESIGTLRTA
ncbi:MAG: methyl-accepting chemotaxis protein [Pseudomonadota bacterium]